MLKSILILICSALIFPVLVFADCLEDEDAVIYSLETSDVACADGIDCVLTHIEKNPNQYPWGDAALGRVWVLGGICGDFAILKLYRQNKGFAQLKKVAAENPDDFYAPMWLGASAAESNYLFVSDGSARSYLTYAVEILMGSDLEKRAYFLSYCYYFFGLIEKDSGDLRRALNNWELAVEIDPGGRMAKRASKLIDIFTG